MAKNRKQSLNLQIKTFIRDNLRHFKQAIVEAGKEGEASEPKSPGEVRLERAVQIVNGVVDIPFLPEWAEELLFKAIITAIVEFAKSIYGNKDWLAEV